MVDSVAQAHQPQRVLGRDWAARNFGDQRDVLARRQAGNEVVELKHEADVLAAKRGEVAVGERGKLDVAEEHPPRRRGVDAAENVEQGRLAAARRPEQHDDLALEDRQVDAAQRLDLGFAGAIDLGEALCQEGGPAVRPWRFACHARATGRASVRRPRVRATPPPPRGPCRAARPAPRRCARRAAAAGGRRTAASPTFL